MNGGKVNTSETRITSSTGGQKGTKFQRPGLIPADVLLEFSQIYSLGAQKYDDNNWRKGYDWHLSLDAALRHLLLFESGEDYDNCKCPPPDDSGNRLIPEYPCEGCGATGQKHILQVAWHCFTLAWYMDHKREFDDRAIRFDESEAAARQMDELLVRAKYGLSNIGGVVNLDEPKPRS